MFEFFLPFALSSKWAVLMAGSRGYSNYRHQADVFHLYSILIERGFDPKHIITLAYNDVVYSPSNPFQGQVFSTADHINRYPGDEAIDYSGNDANGENLIRVLLGDERHGPALKTGPQDDIFIYYCDHGAPGLLCVPLHNGPQIYADQIRKTFEQMHSEKKYNNIFFVIEACYSGSIGNGYTVPGVFMITASGPQQSSFSADWDHQLQTCRTNEFTKQFRFFVLSKPESPIIDLVNSAATGTFKSHVSAYGDFTVSKRSLSDFLLASPPIDAESVDPSYYTTDVFSNVNIKPNGGKNTLDMRTKNSFITFLELRAKTAKAEEKLKLEKLLEHEKERRIKSKTLFNNISKKIQPNGGEYGPLETLDIIYDCYRTSVEGFRLFCGEVDEYELPKLAIFGHLCKVSPKEQILAQIRQSCPQRMWAAEELTFD